MKKTLKALIAAIIITISLFTTFIFTQANSSIYTVNAGETLWSISNKLGVTIDYLKAVNNLSSDMLYIGQTLKTAPDSHLYTVKSGDTLWGISNSYKISIADLKTWNHLSSDELMIGQILKILPDTINYTVKSGDTLYTIATKFNTTTTDIIKVNKLSNTIIYIGQLLLVPFNAQTVKLPTPTPTPAPSPAPTPTPSHPAPVLNYPSITYIVQYGDTASSIAVKFNTTLSNILKYNYMNETDWFSAGQKIAINGYAPRDYAVLPGESAAPTKYGKIVDWFRDGQYLIKRNDVFKITDFYTGKSFTVKMLGGFNHSDVEPLTAQDTAVMQQIFGTWTWSPRPVVIFHNGMNIAASLSGMPHSYDTTPSNGVTGHFDLYLKNSIPHSNETSGAYVQQHYNNIPIAAGIQ